MGGLALPGAPGLGAAGYPAYPGEAQSYLRGLSKGKVVMSLRGAKHCPGEGGPSLRGEHSPVVGWSGPQSEGRAQFCPGGTHSEGEGTALS